MTTRREILAHATALAAGTAACASSAVDPALPWLRRAFHMYSTTDGVSAMRELELPRPQALASQWLIRREAARVTVGLMGPGYMMGFHVANQPNILIPLFGTLLVKLKDGSGWAFRHGDLLFAEDCTGGGHISGAGPEGCFSVSVQLPKTARCLDPAAEVTDLFGARGKPAF
jgi:hypothetical protein